jgi:hypothetical protein
MKDRRRKKGEHEEKEMNEKIEGMKGRRKVKIRT